jgi:hypothetical protein
MKLLLILVVVNALDNLGPYEGRLGNDSLQRHHVVQLTRAESSRIDRIFAETSNVCAVVYHIVGCFLLGSVGKGAYDVFEGTVKCRREIEGLVEKTVGKFAVM